MASVDGGTLAATGAVNLVDQSLDMHLTAVLPKEISQKVGGSGIGGFMNTALANKSPSSSFTSDAGGACPTLHSSRSHCSQVVTRLLCFMGFQNHSA